MNMSRVPLDFGKPRVNCLAYVLLHGGGENAVAYLVTRERFNDFLENDMFIDGPYVEFFGDIWGDPFNPFKQAYGTLNIDAIVYCELNTFYEQRFFASLN